MAVRRSGIDLTLVMAIGGRERVFLGFVIWMVTEAFVFLPVFLAAGLVRGDLHSRVAASPLTKPRFPAC